MKLSGMKQEISLVMLAKLVLHPVIVMLCLIGWFELDPTMSAVAVILASMPMFGVYAVIGQRYHRRYVRSSITTDHSVSDGDRECYDHLRADTISIRSVIWKIKTITKHCASNVLNNALGKRKLRMGKLCIAAKITHVPTMIMSEQTVPFIRLPPSRY